MKKRILSLALAICLCLSLFTFAAPTASADSGIEVWVNGTMLDIDGYSRPLGNGIGSAAAGLAGNKLTVTLSRAQIGSPKYIEDVSQTCGVYIRAANGQDIEILLDGESECYGDFYIDRNGAGGTVSFVNGTNQDGALTVHGQTVIQWASDIAIENVKLDFMADQTMDFAAFLAYGDVSIGLPEVLGGGAIIAPEVTIGYDNTDRPLGMYAYSLNVFSGTTSIMAKTVGAFLQPNNVDVTAFTGRGGNIDFYGYAAGLLIEDYDASYYYGKPYSFSGGFGELNGCKSRRSACVASPIESSDDTVSYYSWYYTDGAIENISEYIGLWGYDWYNADFNDTAAKGLSFGVQGPVWATFDAGEYGDIGGESFTYKYCVPGEPIGLLPVPVNTTFHSGTFNNMYFEGWQVKGEPGNIIDESYIVPSETLPLEAVWMEGQTSLNFTDVKSSAWYYEPVRYCFGQGLLNGTSATTFSPNTNCSRAMIVTILYRMDGSLKTSGMNPFSDVQNGKWYTDAIIWAAENNIVNGDGKGHFMPNDNVTREQLAKIMKAYAAYSGRYNPDAGIMLTGFPDADSVSGWAGESMSWAVGMGFVNGKPKDGKNYLDPKGNATRAEVATILLRYIKAFDGSREYYYGDVMWAEVPAFWSGNVVCRYNEEAEALCFYAKKCYQAYEGLGSRLFWVSARPNGEDLTKDANFQTVLGALLIDSEIYYNVCLYLPTDIQCEFTRWQSEGAQYFDMCEAYNDFDFDSFYYTFSVGKG